MNTNLKIALMLGYSFDSHKIYHAQFFDGLKIMDTDDYQMFNYNKNPLQTMRELEKILNIEFEFERKDKIWQMYALHGVNCPNIKTVQEKSFHKMMKQAIELAFPHEKQTEMEDIKLKYPYHYYGILNASK